MTPHAVTGLSNLISLTVEGCNVTASCLDPISGFFLYIFPDPVDVLDQGKQQLDLEIYIELYCIYLINSSQRC